MHQEEADYWDKEALQKGDKDNPWKRAAIISRIFNLNWIDHRILEIGTGQGKIASILHYIFLNHLKYKGTDVSKIYCDFCRDKFRLNMTQTDILNLPVIDDGFTRVIALDSLEHVRPEDRDNGYRCLGGVLAPNATMVINMPMNDSCHDNRFDHKFTAKDITRLGELAEMELLSLETYKVYPNGNPAYYGWAVLQRGSG